MCCASFWALPSSVIGFLVLSSPTKTSHLQHLRHEHHLLSLLYLVPPVHHLPPVMVGALLDTDYMILATQNSGNSDNYDGSNIDSNKSNNERKEILLKVSKTHSHLPELSESAANYNFALPSFGPCTQQHDAIFRNTKAPTSSPWHFLPQQVYQTQWLCSTLKRMWEYWCWR